MNPFYRWSRIGRSILHLNRPREVATLTRMMALGQQHSLLDVGCGDGYLTSRFARRAREVVGIDPDRKMISTARTLNSGPNLRFEEGFAEKLPYPSGTFDRVTAVSVVEHFGDPLAGLREMARVLKPGGILAISVDSLLPENSPEDFRKWHAHRYHVTTYFRNDQILGMLRDCGLVPDTDAVESIHSSRWGGALRRIYTRRKTFCLPLFPVFLVACRLSDTFGLGGRMPPQILIVRAHKPTGEGR